MEDYLDLTCRAGAWTGNLDGGLLWSPICHKRLDTEPQGACAIVDCGGGAPLRGFGTAMIYLGPSIGGAHFWIYK